ncbi:MAG: response regulator [Verrucomicrobiales bacterium]
MPLASRCQSPAATILVVEDEASVRETVAHSLRYLGYNVLEAGNGEQGLAISRENRGQIDMIFTDVVMPRMSGPAMVSSMRQEKITFPVLYTTGFADDPGIADEDNLIIKPYTTKLLAARIRETLDHVKA